MDHGGSDLTNVGSGVLMGESAWRIALAFLRAARRTDELSLETSRWLNRWQLLCWECGNTSDRCLVCGRYECSC